MELATFERNKKLDHNILELERLSEIIHLHFLLLQKWVDWGQEGKWLSQSQIPSQPQNWH